MKPLSPSLLELGLRLLLLELRLFFGTRIVLTGTSIIYSVYFVDFALPIFDRRKCTTGGIRGYPLHLR